MVSAARIALSGSASTTTATFFPFEPPRSRRGRRRRRPAERDPSGGDHRALRKAGFQVAAPLTLPVPPIDATMTARSLVAGSFHRRRPCCCSRRARPPLRSPSSSRRSATPERSASARASTRPPCPRSAPAHRAGSHRADRSRHAGAPPHDRRRASGRRGGGPHTGGDRRVLRRRLLPRRAPPRRAQAPPERFLATANGGATRTRSPGTIGRSAWPAMHTQGIPCGALVQGDGTQYLVAEPYRCDLPIAIKAR